MSELLEYILNNEDRFKSKGRLISLYSDFRHLRATNPEGYAANISAWQQALAHAVGKGCYAYTSGERDTLILHTGDELLSALEVRNAGRPAALGTVIADAVVSKRMVPLKEFMASTRSIYTADWTTIPWKVLSWGLRQAGLGFEREERLANDKLVIVQNLEEATKQVKARIPQSRNPVDRVLTRQAFEEKFRNVLAGSKGLTETDFDVLLKYLERDVRIIVYKGETIRFRLQGDQPIISTEDTSIASIKALLSNLEKAVEDLTKHIDKCAAEARQAVINKNRTRALAMLKTKKLAEANLAKRHETLAQVEGVYTKITQAADQVEILRVMEASTNVLKDLNARTGGVDKVDEVMLGLATEMDQTEEIGNAITQPNLVEDEEIEEELEALVKKESREKADEQHERNQEILKELKVPTSLETKEGASSIIDEDLERSIDAMKNIALDA